MLGAQDFAGQKMLNPMILKIRGGRGDTPKRYRPGASLTKQTGCISWVQKIWDKKISRSPGDGAPSALLVSQTLHLIQLRSAGGGNGAEDDSDNRRNDDRD